MKVLPFIISNMVLSALLLSSRAQTPATPHGQPAQTAAQRAASYQGPKVTGDSKALGRKMVQKSKPTDMLMRVPARKIK